MKLVFSFLVFFQWTCAFGDADLQSYTRAFECQVKLSKKSEKETNYFEVYGCGKSGPAKIIYWKDDLEPMKLFIPGTCTLSGTKISEALNIEFLIDATNVSISLSADQKLSRRDGTLQFGKDVSGKVTCLRRY